ncbi:uncharacterized protein LOC129613495 [Condylostylus longicornis]|uniref:uncharacterized protein LOC129613495 n=1 Tax=Condylostylus longicornis TaxID=2530218 RepID=UPI00244DE83E|nr:uncharacterized protein LOC129613495 [Condylostylus longicornis]
MQDFERKRKNLFELLENEEKKLKGTILEQKEYKEDETKSIRRQKQRLIASDKPVERLIGRESIFKKPELPIQKCLKPRTDPDYKVNPHKWTKYSLEDADISDKANTSAAFAFLKEIEKRKEMQEYEIKKTEDDKNELNSNDSQEKIVFNKTATLKRSIRSKDDEVDDVETQTPKFKSSKFVMPEYVIGQKNTKKKKNLIDKSNTNKGKVKELKLSHLSEYDDGEDEGE